MKDVIAEPYRARVLLPGFNPGAAGGNRDRRWPAGFAGLKGRRCLRYADKPEDGAARRGLAEQTLSAKSGRLRSYLPAEYGGRAVVG